MPELLLALAGNPGSGKTSISNYVAARYGIPRVTGSEILLEWAGDLGIDLVSRTDYTNFHHRMSQERGTQALIGAILERQGTKGLINDGLRVWSDSETFKSLGGKVIALWCPLNERLSRVSRLNDSKYRTDNADAFLADEVVAYNSSDPHGQHTLKVMGAADYDIEANRPLEEVFAQIDAIIAQI